jgi:hypothetical protein
MKLRIISFIALFTLFAALVSCTGEEEDRAGQIDLSGIVRESAFTGETDIADAGGFRLYTYSHLGAWQDGILPEILLDNGGGYVDVAYDGAGWYYGPTILWPTNRRVSFFAYAPRDADVHVDAPGAPSVPAVSIDIPGNPYAQTDLLIAGAKYSRLGPDPVQEVFHHALSRIELSAYKSGLTAHQIVIRRVEFRNVYSRGTAELDYPAVWSADPSSRTSYSLAVDEGTLLDAPLRDYEMNIMQDGVDGLYLLPQDLYRGGWDVPVTVEIRFSLNGIEMTWEGELPGPAAWQPDTIHRYRIDVDGELVTIVYSTLEPAIPGDDWPEGAY